MAEQTYTEITLRFKPGVLERLKDQFKTPGSKPMSATQTVEMAIETCQRDAKAVRLDEPERKEIESRTGAQAPIRCSKDILRALDRVQGGQDAVTVDLDPGLAVVMRDIGHGMGYGLSEFAKIVLEESYMTQFVNTIDLRPIYFSRQEFSKLLEITGQSRIRSGSELLNILSDKILQESEKTCSAPVVVDSIQR